MLNPYAQNFAKERSEDDVMQQKELPLKLGKEYAVKPLTIKKGREWRDKVAKVLNELATGPMNAGNITGTSFMQGLMVAFFSFPDKVLDLLYEYAPELRDVSAEIEDSATDEEVVLAFSRVLAVAYPYFPLLGSMKTAAMAANQASRQQ